MHRRAGGAGRSPSAIDRRPCASSVSIFEAFFTLQHDRGQGAGRSGQGIRCACKAGASPNRHAGPCCWPPRSAPVLSHDVVHHDREPLLGRVGIQQLGFFQLLHGKPRGRASSRGTRVAGQLCLRQRPGQAAGGWWCARGHGGEAMEGEGSSRPCRPCWAASGTHRIDTVVVLVVLRDAGLLKVVALLPPVHDGRLTARHAALQHVCTARAQAARGPLRGGCNGQGRARGQLRH